MSSSFKDDIFASIELGNAMPKFSMPDGQQSPKAVYQALHDELLLDGNSRQNLATFCQTWLDDEIHKIMDECIDKNMIDKDEYPQTAEIENRCVRILADLWHSPEAKTTLGCSTPGSSEAAMLGAMALKWQWRKKSLADGKTIDKPNLVTGPVQVCWHKFCRYWDVELREIPVEGDHLIMKDEDIPSYVEKYCDENTIGFVPTLGVTFTGQYENVKALSDALDAFEAKTGLNIPIHVDGASGAFLAPFVTPDLEWDFRLKRVKSINASGHKFGLAPLGCGWVVWRTAEDLPEELIFNVNYLGGNMPTFALNFSRPGGQVVSQYYNFLRLGREGYTKIHQACYETTRFLAEEMEKMGIFRIISDGSNGIPAVAWSFKEPAKMSYSLYDLSEKLRSRGWLVPAYSMPAHREDLVVMRILVRHGFSKDLASLYLEDLARAVEYYKNHAPSTPLREEESVSFSHHAKALRK